MATELQPFVSIHWLALLSLFVALLGGVPGLIAVVNEWRARPRLVAYLYRLTTFSVPSMQDPRKLGVLLQVAIGNKGGTPLIPLAFDLSAKVSGKRVNFLRATIQEGFTITWPTASQLITNLEDQDLHRLLPTITREGPARGYLAFCSNLDASKENIDAVLACQKRITCVNIDRRRFDVELNETTVNQRAESASE